MTATVLPFDHPERIERAFWARRRFGPQEFDAFLTRWGIETNDIELARRHVNAMLDRLEANEGRDYVTKLFTFGGEQIAAMVGVRWWA